MIIFKHIGECANKWVCSVTLSKGQSSLLMLSAVCNDSLSLNYLLSSSVSNASAFNLFCYFLLKYFLQLLLYKTTILTSPREHTFSVIKVLFRLLLPCYKLKAVHRIAQLPSRSPSVS